MFLSLQIFLLTLSEMASKGPYTQRGFCMHALCPLVAWRSAGEVSKRSTLHKSASYPSRFHLRSKFALTGCLQYLDPIDVGLRDMSSRELLTNLTVTSGCGELYSVMRPKDRPHSSKSSWLRARRILHLPAEEGFLIPGLDKSQDSRMLCNERERACMLCTASATQKYICQRDQRTPLLTLASRRNITTIYFNNFSYPPRLCSRASSLEQMLHTI